MSDQSQHLTKTPNIAKYLRDIGVEEPLQQRIELIYSYIQKIVPCRVTDIFVDEYVKEDGTHIYESLTFYADNVTVSAFNFIRKIELHFSQADPKITLMIINSKDYDFEKASDKSRLQIKYYLSQVEQVTGFFKATSKNCDYLMKIHKKYITPPYT